MSICLDLKLTALLNLVLEEMIENNPIKVLSIELMNKLLQEKNVIANKYIMVFKRELEFEVNKDRGIIKKEN